MKTELKIISENTEDTEKLEACLRSEDLLFALAQVYRLIKSKAEESTLADLKNLFTRTEELLQNLELTHLLKYG